MYKLDYKNVKRERIFWVPFMIMGLLLLIAFGRSMLGGTIKKNMMDAKVEAYNIEINSHKDDDGDMLYKPTYYYMVNGKEYIYVSSYSTNIENNEMKQNKVIYYNSQNPSDCVSEYEAKIKPLFILYIILISIFPFVGINGIIKANNKIKKMKWLEENGTLIKGLKYKLVPSNYTIHNSNIMNIEIEYELPSGNIVTLEGDPRFDRKTHDADGLVDLLIDLNNPGNYYIDFSIESSDYDIFNDKNN